MNRATLFTAAALVSAAILVAGCEQDKSSDYQRVGSASGETMNATGQPDIGAKRGTGATASGETTGNVTTAAQAPANSPRPTGAAAPSGNTSASASASASARDAGSSGQTNAAGHGPGGIDEQKTADATASASASPTEVKTTVTVPDGGTTVVGAGPAAVNEGESASGRTAAEAHAAAQPAAAADKKDAKDDDDHDHGEHADAWAKVKPSQAASKDMQVTGTVKFAKADHGVKVMVDLKGLTPNGKHGFHVHEKNDLSDPKLMSVGPHFNPTGKKHGGAEGDERHGGDLGNLTADEKGNVKTTIMAHGVTMDGEKDGIIGRSIIVHAKADDEKTDPSGNSGDRIAGGAIEKASKDEKKSADAGVPAGEAQPAAARGTDAGEGAGPAAVNEAELNK